MQFNRVTFDGVVVCLNSERLNYQHPENTLYDGQTRNIILSLSVNPFPFSDADSLI
jgi:hypothetical protein